MQHFNKMCAHLFEPIAPPGNASRISVFFVQNLQFQPTNFLKPKIEILFKMKRRLQEIC